MRISIFTPPPSAACRAGSYSIFSCTHQACLSDAGIAARSDAVGSMFTPPPAKEKSGFRTYRAVKSSGTRSRSETKVARGTDGWSRNGSEYFDQVQYQFGWGAH